jgi:hypothetical protein
MAYKYPFIVVDNSLNQEYSYRGYSGTCLTILQETEFLKSILKGDDKMKKLCLMCLFSAILLIAVIAQAGEWVLWEFEHKVSKDGSESKKPLPLEEFQTLKACQAASAKTAYGTYAWAKKIETVKNESVARTINPDGVIYQYITGQSVHADYRCYPFGAVPSESNNGE